jgi:TolA-binding protein
MNQLEKLGREIAGEQDRQVASLDSARMSERLRASLPAFDGRDRVRSRIALGSLLAAAFVFACLWFARGFRQSLEFYVDGAQEGTRRESTWISAPDDRQVPIGFSDGSRVVLGNGARARVTGIERTGASLAVEQGSVAVAIVPRSGNRWRIDLGPFAVEVTGTRFEVNWNPSTERFHLTMHEGKVTVTGCAIGTRTFAAGDVLEVSCRDQQFRIQSAGTGTGTEVGHTGTAPAGAEDPAASPSERAADSKGEKTDDQKSAAAGPSRWRTLVQAGRYREAIEAADAAGFEAECQHASAADLLALAGAARLTGDAPKARQAYSLLRKRFGSDPVAAVAAFNLARVAFDLVLDYTDAAQWFRTYLREQPAGALAREARGRLIEALQRSGDATGARAAAIDYLSRYPNGPHTEFAKRLAR